MTTEELFKEQLDVFYGNVLKDLASLSDKMDDVQNRLTTARKSLLSILDKPNEGSVNNSIRVMEQNICTHCNGTKVLSVPNSSNSDYAETHCPYCD